jgi:hypothetical protein
MAEDENCEGTTTTSPTSVALTRDQMFRWIATACEAAIVSYATKWSIIAASAILFLMGTFSPLTCTCAVVVGTITYVVVRDHKKLWILRTLLRGNEDEAIEAMDFMAYRCGEPDWTRLSKYHLMDLVKKLMDYLEWQSEQRENAGGGMEHRLYF